MRPMMSLNIFCAWICFCSCKVSSDKSKLGSPPANSTRSTKNNSDEIPPKLGAALLQLASTLKSFKPPANNNLALSATNSSTTETQTVGQKELKTIHTLSENTADIDVNTLFTFFQSPAFEQLKIDYRAGTSPNPPHQSPQSLALAAETSDSSSQSTKVSVSAPSTWFNWVGSANSNNKEQLTIMGAAFFLTLAVVNIAFVKFDYHKALQLLKNRRFFASAACFAVLADIGVAITDIGLMSAGISGNMEKKTFDQIEGASIVVGGGAMALMGIVGLGSLMDPEKIKTDSEYMKKLTSNKKISEKIPISHLNATRIGLGVFLGFGVLSATYGSYKIANAHSLQLVDSDPNAAFFPQLVRDFKVLFAIHDEMHQG